MMLYSVARNFKLISIFSLLIIMQSFANDDFNMQSSSFGKKDDGKLEVNLICLPNKIGRILIVSDLTSPKCNRVFSNLKRLFKSNSSHEVNTFEGMLPTDFSMHISSGDYIFISSSSKIRNYEKGYMPSYALYKKKGKGNRFKRLEIIDNSPTDEFIKEYIKEHAEAYFCDDEPVTTILIVPEKKLNEEVINDLFHGDHCFYSHKTSKYGKKRKVRNKKKPHNQDKLCMKIDLISTDDGCRGDVILLPKFLFDTPEDKNACSVVLGSINQCPSLEERFYLGLAGFGMNVTGIGEVVGCLEGYQEVDDKVGASAAAACYGMAAGHGISGVGKIGLGLQTMMTAAFCQQKNSVLKHAFQRTEQVGDGLTFASALYGGENLVAAIHAGDGAEVLPPVVGNLTLACVERSPGHGIAAAGELVTYLAMQQYKKAHVKNEQLIQQRIMVGNKRNRKQRH
ncbi:MAG: hypothetical protein PUP46_08930 [Endozoicomonas sp. (ex Botrylloides leachii)]|nr:hypothetical protein [Endozoicomonas sp. (ex Botrylloides leachii)]